MKVSELPPKLKELLEIESKKQGKTICNDSVDISLTWASSEQGRDFWAKIHRARSIDDLPEPYNKPEEEIINSYSIF